MNMMKWMELLFQNAVNLNMWYTDWLHDFSIMVLLAILMLLLSMMVYFFYSSYLGKFTIEHTNLEMIWTILPCVILVALGMPSLINLFNIELQFAQPCLSIKCTGNQWYWNYSYSDISSLEFDSFMNTSCLRLLETDNRVVLPFKSLIRFIISSNDVLHSWAVPALGVKTDANPGRLSFSDSLSMFPGVYYGQCSEICGTNHSFMPICVEFNTPNMVLNWMQLS